VKEVETSLERFTRIRGSFYLINDNI